VSCVCARSTMQEVRAALNNALNAAREAEERVELQVGVGVGVWAWVWV